MKKAKRLLSLFLVFLMVFGTAPSSFATTETPESGTSYFDFNCTEYGTTEDAGIFEVKVVRSGDGNGEANVSFKIADFLSTYGQDYVVLDNDGKELSKIYGEKPDMDDFEITKVNGIYNVSMKNSSTSSAETAAASSDDISAQSEETAESGSSSLKDAQAALLGLPEGTTEEQAKSAISETLNDLQQYFVSAEGAEGKIHFSKGQNEKTIRIKVLDNDRSNASRIFMIALMGTDSESAKVAVNATTYVTIDDDEEAVGSEFALSGEQTLTPDNPEGYVTIKRTGNTDRISEVYVSTVKGSLNENAYTSFTDESVLFLPGQTEKSVKVKATDFSKDGQFRVRLECDSRVDSVNRSGLFVKIKVKSSSGDAMVFDNAEGEGIVLGKESINYGITLGPDGWKRDVTGSDGDNYAYVKNDRLYCGNYDDDKHSCLGSNNKLNFTGIVALQAYMDLNSSDRNNYTTHFRVGDGNTYYGAYDAQFSKSGKFAGTYSIDTSSINADKYVRFEVTPDDWGKQNPKGWLSDITSIWAQYSFICESSAESFSRKIYSFAEGTPFISQTRYDGKNQTDYNPGSVTVKVNGTEVSGFYANSGQTVKITADYSEDNERYGYHLKGVYFANSSLTAKTMHDASGYRNTDVYYAAANSNNSVDITLNQDFLSKLINAGVVSSENKNEGIKIFPVFEQDNVTVTFANADRPEGNNSYDSKNLYSHFANILEAGLRSKTVNGVTCYSMDIPCGSVLKLKLLPDSSRTAAGIGWYYTDSPANVNKVYYKEGETRYGSQGKTMSIARDDYTMGEIVLTDDITVVPLTGKQTLYVGYVPNVNKDSGIPSDLTGVVSSIKDGNIENATDSTGAMLLESVYIGKNLTLNAIAPEGYYTSWVNMTGDVNNDGSIDSEEGKAVTEEDVNKSKNARYAYGSVLNLNLDMDNTRYYYKFVKNDGAYSGTHTGTVRREKTSFYNLANNIRSSTYTPVSAAYVDVAGFKAMTDLNGKFSVPLYGLPSFGYISVAVYSDNQTYSTQTSIERSSLITLPALEMFNAEKLTANYDTKKTLISGNTITATDDFLTVSATISSDTAVTPKAAQFMIYDKDGKERAVCEGENFQVDTSYRNGKLVASLRFNPKGDIQNLDKLYVRFCDTNDQWYEPIDLGYTFYSELTMDKFVFAMLGSTTLDGIFTGDGIVTDIIGNPLGGISLGTIGAFDVNPSQYTPAGVSEEEADQYTWQRVSYSFGWDKTFGPALAKTLHKWESAPAAEKTEAMEKVESGDVKGDTPEGAKYSTETKLKWNITPSVGFNLTISNRATGTYFEDLTFYVGCDFYSKLRTNIGLPIGMSVILELELQGGVKGIYHMYNEYTVANETEGATKYNAEEFGLFKSFSNNVRREGYIFLDPSIRVSAGVSVSMVGVVVDAIFDFDMDFQFKETGVRAYGDMNINMGFTIELFSFRVYSKTLKNYVVKLFNSKGVDGHIEFNTSTGQLDLKDYLTVDNEDVDFNTPGTRAYLENRTDWLDNPFALGSGKVAPMSVDSSSGTTIFTLRTGTMVNPRSEMFSIDDEGNMLLVFLDDDTSRSDANKSAVYYSIGKDDKWSKPVLLEDDGTIDDYLYATDLGNGEILVAWTTTDKALEDGEGLNEALSNANIHTAIFDKEAKKFGEVNAVTKQTDEDRSANVINSVSYSKESNQIIYFYDKYEYGRLMSWDDVSLVKPVMAYRVYDLSKSKMLDGDSYTAEEQTKIKASGKDLENYKVQWYGQRFADLRNSALSTDTMEYTGFDSQTMHIDAKEGSEAVDCIVNAWTVDMDGDLVNTTDDRYLMCMIMDSNNLSDYMLLQVNQNEGYYCNPEICVEGENVFLFYGTHDSEGENSRIEYLNLTGIYYNKLFTKVDAGGIKFYEMRYTPSADKQETWVKGDVAVYTSGIEDFDVVTKNDIMALIWTSSDEGGRGIFASVYYGSDNYNDENKEPGIKSAEEAVSFNSDWSDAFQLTESEEGIYYMGINPVISDGKLYVSAGRGNYNDESDTAFILLKHTPYSKAEITDLTVSNTNAAPGDTVAVTATIQNTGMLPLKKDIRLSFSNGKTTEKKDVQLELSGGDKTSVTVYMKAPDSATMRFTVSDNYGNRQFADIQRKAELAASKQSIVNHADADDTYVYSATLTNSGNLDSGKLTVKACVGDTVVGSKEISAVRYGTSEKITMELVIPDELFSEGETAETAKVTVKITEGENEISSFEGEVTGDLSSDVIKLLRKAAGVKASSAYYLISGEQGTIQPEITGAEKGSLAVEWISTSDASVASIDASNCITGNKQGTATLKGIIVPSYYEYRFTSSGSSVKADWRDLIPAKYLTEVEVTVNVTELDENNPFRDVLFGKWFYDSVKYCYANGIMKGMSSDIFGPDGKVSRAMFVTVLYRLEGEPQAGNARFADVSADKYYNKAVAWASENKIVKGISETSFAPDASITRQQAAAMLYRYAQYKELEGVADRADISKFADYGKVADYAEEALGWCVKAALIKGVSDTALDPQGTTTRAQLAAIMQRLCEGYGLLPEIKENKLTHWTPSVQ